MEWGAFGWLTIAAIVGAAASAMHPATRAGRRYLERHVPPDVLAILSDSHRCTGARRSRHE